MIVPPELRPREVLGVVSPVTRGIDDEPREDWNPKGSRNIAYALPAFLK